MAYNSAGSESMSISNSTCNQVELPRETHYEETETNNDGESSSGTHVLEGRQSWNYRIDEIDPSIVDELPPEIQQEVRALLRPLKRPNVAKRGSSITHYFHPNKNGSK